MLKKIAQSSEIRIFSCISSLCLYVGFAITNINAFIHKGQFDVLASDPTIFPKVSLAEFTAQTLPLVAGSVVALILLFYRPEPSRRKGSLILVSLDLLGKIPLLFFLFLVMFRGGDGFQKLMLMFLFGMPVYVGALFDVSVIFYLKVKPMPEYKD